MLMRITHVCMYVHLYVGMILCMHHVRIMYVLMWVLSNSNLVKQQYNIILQNLLQVKLKDTVTYVSLHTGRAHCTDISIVLCYLYDGPYNSMQCYTHYISHILRSSLHS